MRPLLLGSAAALALSGAALAQQSEVRLGVIFGFTGAIESLAPAIAQGGELAMEEVTASGALLDGLAVTPVRADSTCSDAAAATANAERLITAEDVVGLVGPDCSGVTTAVLQNVAMPNGIVVISPAATSPALSDMEDNGLFFRTAPSDARQGQVLAEVLNDRGIATVALTYTNNDYGQGFADAFTSAFEGMDGTVTLSAAHEDGRGDYSSEVAALAAAGGEALVVLGYVDQGGAGIIRSALDTGAFELFAVGDGMIGDALTDSFGSEIEGSIGTAPGSETEGGTIFEGLAEEAGFDGSSIYSGESYDAAALIMMAMQAAGSTDPAEYSGEILDIANAPGTEILPGQLGQALDMIAAGEEIDYVGASGVELVGGGEAAGSYIEFVVEDGELTGAGFR